MDYAEKVIGYIEVHDVEGIRQCFLNGVSPNQQFNNMPLIYELISEYARTPRFSECVTLFIEHGLLFEDAALLAVLSNNAVELLKELRRDPSLLHRRYTLRCAYTPLYQVTLLHICAEFNVVDCAQILVQHGADINAAAGYDSQGFGGQTPIFHTVNQNSNNSSAMLHFLLSQAANLHITVPGIIWGEGYPWETFLPSVNPLSYAMMGLLPQMHRNETTISQTVSLLLKAAYDINYVPPNVPNAYLR